MRQADIVTSLIIEAIQSGAANVKKIIDRIAGSYTVTGKEVIKDGAFGNREEITERGGNG